jgi:hypothetical protein
MVMELSRRVFTRHLARGVNRQRRAGIRPRRSPEISPHHTRRTAANRRLLTMIRVIHAEPWYTLELVFIDDMITHHSTRYTFHQHNVLCKRSDPRLIEGITATVAASLSRTMRCFDSYIRFTIRTVPSFLEPSVHGN